VKYLALLLTSLLPLTGQDFRVTEVMANSLNGTDWFEITNFGENSASLSGFSWRDQNEQDPLVPLPEVTFTSGESVIFLISGSVAEFQAWWDLEAAVQVVRLADNPELSLPRISSEGDQVSLYNASQELADQFKTGHFPEGVSHSKLAGGTTVPSSELRRDQYGYRPSLGTARINGFTVNEWASPGEVGEEAAFPPVLEMRRYTHEWPTNLDLANSTFRIRATDPNPNDDLTITMIEAPDWLSLQDEGNGTASLQGTPPIEAVRSFFFRLLVTDNTGLDSQGDRNDPDNSIVLDILPTSSPIILNEYNGVATGGFLGDREDEVPARAFDPTLGRVASNGGFWMEFVVVGSGNGPEEVDIRGWRFRVTSNPGVNDSSSPRFSFQLNNNPALAKIPAGTILTFTAGDDILPSVLNDDINALSEGFFHTNINLYDLTFVEMSEFNRTNADRLNRSGQLSITVSTSDHNVILGPAGERSARRDDDQDGIFENGVNIGPDEVFKLEADPTPQTSPIFGVSDGGYSSTFGAPNEWNDRQSRQSFSAYRPENLPPRVSGSPSLSCIRGTYQASFSFTDPEGQVMSTSLVNSPDFLSLTRTGPGTCEVSLNREIQPRDWGDHIVTIRVDDGSELYSSGDLSYRLSISNPSPTVIVNEFNAVTKEVYLNGGTESSDQDGDPPASDATLGRRQGNGGDWIELVVVGTGGPSVVDLRGWSIAIGTSVNGGDFDAFSGLTLSNHPDLGAVPAGTIIVLGSPRFDAVTPYDDRFREEGWRRLEARTDSPYIIQNSFDPWDLRINAQDNLICISDREGRTIFGPVGETTIQGVKLGNDEVFELEAHASPSISIHDSSAEPGTFGYDDSDSESTMGLPNRFTDGDGNLVTQNFQSFIPAETSYELWATSQGLPPNSQSGDHDEDDHSNLKEYLAGSNPTNDHDQPLEPRVSGFPSDPKVIYETRVNDPTYRYLSEMSRNLLNWTTAGLLVTDTPSPRGVAFRRRVLEQDRPVPLFEDRRPPFENLFYRNRVFKKAE
jgi:hypothetical protein